MPVLLSSIGVYMRWQLLADSPSREFYARTEVSVLLSTRPTALSSARNLAGWGTFCLEGSSSDGKGRGGPRLRWTDERGGKTWAYPANAGLLHVGSYVRSSGDSASPIDAVSELGTYSTFRVPTPTMIPLVVLPHWGTVPIASQPAWPDATRGWRRQLRPRPDQPRGRPARPPYSNSTVSDDRHPNFNRSAALTWSMRF